MYQYEFERISTISPGSGCWPDLCPARKSTRRLLRRERKKAGGMWDFFRLCSGETAI